MTSQVHPYESTETPDLRILPLDCLVEHEYNDVQRTRPLAERLEVEGVLKNPPIVAPLDDGENGGEQRYVVLDGANRTTALQMLGYPHVLAQVVRYENPPVTLTTWHHVVCGLEPSDYFEAIRAVDRLELNPMDLLHARAGLARRDLLAYLICSDGDVFGIRTEARTLHEQNELLNRLVDTYKERGRLYRAAADNIEAARQFYPDLTGLVIFPRYEASEVMALARDGELLPTGLTRHFIQGRALRTNYPLSELRSSDSLEDKNARLREWLRHKLGSKEIRFYGESTFLFDE